MATLIYNQGANNQFRLVTSLRRDNYQIPNDPDAQAGGPHWKRIRETNHDRVLKGR